MKAILKSTIFLGLFMLTMAAYAQKGVGEQKGISRQGLNPEIIELTGTVKQVKNSPCGYTTGRSIAGIHLMVETSDKKMFNVHLGPTTELSDFAAKAQGKEIKIMAFRTKKLPDGHYIAKELTSNGENTVLRDENLKPFWAGRFGRRNGRGRRGNP